MDVLNKKERQSAFWKFLSLFLLTFGLAVFAVYFNMKVPQKENKVLNQKIKESEILSVSRTSYANLLDSLVNNLDTLNTSEGSKEVMDRIIADQIAELNRRKPKGDAAHNNVIYDNTTQLALKAHTYMTQMRDVSLADKSAAECEEEIRRLELENLRLESDVKLYKGLNNQQ